MTVVRELTPDDWALWRDVRLQSLLDSPAAFGSTHERELGFSEQLWRERLADPGALSVLAWRDDDPVGIGAGIQDEPGHLHVGAMWVAQQARGQGVAHLVLDALGAWAGARGMRLHLDVETSNVAARRCYESYGFVAIGTTTPLREGSQGADGALSLSGRRGCR